MNAQGTLSTGQVTGPISKDYLACQYLPMINSRGIWFGHDPLEYSLPGLMAQLILIFFVTRSIYFFLRPLSQDLTAAQILAGILIGPSFLMRLPLHLNKLFALEKNLMLQTATQIGFMLHLFLIGVKMDPSIVKKAGKKAVLIGTAGFVLPYVLGLLGYLIINHYMTLNKEVAISLTFIVAVDSLTSFAVTTSLLTDLNILNSDLGRLATSTSIVADFCSWCVATITNTMGIATQDSRWKSFGSVIVIAIFMITIFCILRPFILWIAKHTPPGKPVKESHFFAILVLILGCGLLPEVIGQHAGFGPFLLGIAVPDGPPLGSTLVQKLDVIATGLLLPPFFAIGGLYTNVLSLGGTRSALITEFIIILGYIGKFTGTILAALFCGVPRLEAFCLALIMCCKGIIEVATYIMWKDYKILNDESFSLLLISMLIVTGLARPIIKHLYDPSRRYKAYVRTTILQSHSKDELQILVCMHNEDNVPGIINLLEASNPTRSSIISVFVIHLMELTGRASAILVPYDPQNKAEASSGFTHSEQFVNAFNNYKQRNQGRVTLQYYTAIAPYASMHDDICTLALDKKTNMVIVPFHKQQKTFGTMEATFPFIRSINRNVLSKAPCSVGVLINRDRTGGNQSFFMGLSLYRVALLFLGGADDREALAFGRRMAKHQNVSFAVVCLKPSGHYKYEIEEERNLDMVLINDFRHNAVDNERIIYIEKTVKDGEETTRVIRSMDDAFDLFIVGRYHDPKSPLTLGLAEWNEYPELGAIGDVLATSDFQFSVLVVQQEPPQAGFQGNDQNTHDFSDGVGNSRMLHDFSDDEGETPLNFR